MTRYLPLYESLYPVIWLVIYHYMTRYIPLYDSL